MSCSVVPVGSESCSSEARSNRCNCVSVFECQLLLDLKIHERVATIHTNNRL